MRITLDRESVASGDDVDFHETTIEMQDDSTIGDLLARVRAMRYVPSIWGGMATWIVRVGDYRGKPIGVVAQQWDKPGYWFRISQS